MATTKKTNTKKKTTSTKKAEQPVKETKEVKAPEEMSVDELANMFINNDTESIERMKEENKPEETVAEDAVIPSEPELAPAFNNILEEVKAEQPKDEPKPVVEKKKEPKIKKVAEEPKKTEESKQEPLKQPKTSRRIYGYDHFGMIYGY